MLASLYEGGGFALAKSEGVVLRSALCVPIHNWLSVVGRWFLCFGRFLRGWFAYSRLKALHICKAYTSLAEGKLHFCEADTSLPLTEGITLTGELPFRGAKLTII